jgi:tRNA threonylcarbamoyladenosine biosynthesis protein TsaB
MSVILAIDTSSAYSSIAIKRDDGAIFEWEGAEHSSHNEELAPQVSALLQKAALSPRDISLLINGGGPGSFTGLRISLGFMKGMAIALQVPLLSLSSLAAAAASSLPHRGAGQSGIVVALADARRAEIFVGAYDVASRFAILGEEQIIALADLPKFVADLTARHTKELAHLCVLPHDENAAMMLPAQLPRREGAHIAQGLIDLATQHTAQAKFDLGQIAALTPHYLRAVAAKTIAERQNCVK